jgi:Trk K+ transport system NAD-binding subunit
MKKSQNTRQNRWQASMREVGVLFKEFRLPLLIFFLATIGMGILYFYLAENSGEPLNSLPESIYLMLTLAFLQPSGSFPRTAVLQIFYFIMPVIGIGALAQGLAEFGVMLFNRRARSKEWEVAVASTYRNHTVLVGLGHLGFRVVEKLHEMKKPIVVVEQNPSAEMFAAVQKMHIPVIQDDATRLVALENAGVAKAKTIILCSQNDSVNLKIALKARSINPKIRVIVRIFDEDFSKSLQDEFGFIALSGTSMAAPVFAAAATGADITNPITVEGQQLSLARLTINSESKLVKKTVGSIEDNYHVSIILVRHDHETEMHPTDNKQINSGDVLAILGGPDELSKIMYANG